MKKNRYRHEKNCFMNFKTLLCIAWLWACLFIPAASALAGYDLSGEWMGTCNDGDITMSLSQTGVLVTGALQAGQITYELTGDVDNATFHTKGKTTKRLMPLTCDATFTIQGSGQMSGSLRLYRGLKIISSSCDMTLYKKTYMLNFNLLMGHVQKPSNIYLFFSVEDLIGNPVTGLKESDFEIYEDDHLISLYESAQTIIPNPTLYTMATVLLLDMSGSILESETLSPLKESAKSFLSKIAGEEGQEVAIYLFDGRDKIRELVGFTKNVAALQTAIDTLSKNQIANDPGYDVSTNLNGAVQQGLAVLDAQKAAMAEGALFSGALVTFTDGTDQAARVSNSEAVASVTASPHNSFAIGLGGEIDETHLRALGKDGFSPAENTEELDAAFDQIATTIRNQSGKHYILGYCTPKRNGVHTVTLKAKGYTGAFSFAFNSDGFEGGCDPLDILQGMQQGENNQCLLKLQPDSVRRGLLMPKIVVLTITGEEMRFNKKSTVSISGVTVLSVVYKNQTKLTVLARIPQTAAAGAKDVTVTTDDEKLTCFEAFTIQ